MNARRSNIISLEQYQAYQESQAPDPLRPVGTGYVYRRELLPEPTWRRILIEAAAICMAVAFMGAVLWGAHWLGSWINR